MSVYIIRNKETLEQWVADSGKSSWRKPNHAKAAFANSSYGVKRDPLLSEHTKTLGKYEALKFNNQDVYECVELLSSAEERSGMIEKTLVEVYDKLKEIEELHYYNDRGVERSEPRCEHQVYDNITGLLDLVGSVLDKGE